jgi:isopenicillin-N N-acyltransferase like protein
MTEMPGHYQHVVVSGTSWERGHSHGTQARGKIQTNVNRYKASSSLPPEAVCMKYINESYLPAIEKLFPDGLEEMKGIASGAMVELQDVLLLNARYDLARLTGHKVGECTSMAYLGPDGSAIVAQNWDMSAWLHDLDTIIVLESHISTSEASNPATVPGPRRIIALTEAGQLARSGMNSHGLGLCANSLWATADDIPSRLCLPSSLARAMYLHCSNFAAGIKALSTFPRHVSGNLMVASLDLAMDIELTPSSKYILYPEAVDLGCGPEYDNLLITHANHYNSPAMLYAQSPNSSDAYPGGSSLFRDRRLAQLLKTGLRYSKENQAFYGSQTMPKQIPAAKDLSPPATPPTEKDNKEVDQLKLSQDQPGLGSMTSPLRQQISQPSLTVENVKTAFSDHASYPRSLCEHAEKGVEKYGAASSGDKTMTVACVIYDLRRGEMHVSTGNPCRGEIAWKKYTLEMEQPQCEF